MFSHRFDARTLEPCVIKWHNYLDTAIGLIYRVQLSREEDVRHVNYLIYQLRRTHDWYWMKETYTSSNTNRTHNSNHYYCGSHWISRVRKYKHNTYISVFFTVVFDVVIVICSSFRYSPFWCSAIIMQVCMYFYCGTTPPTHIGL